MITEREMVEALVEVLESSELNELLGGEPAAPMPHVRTFEDAMLLTTNKGLIVRVGDEEFQITVVRSR